MDLYAPVKPSVLIVDASPANLSRLADLLHEAYAVKAVNHGAEALKVVSQEMPDLILLDINMPDMDGYEVCQRLKADPLTSHIPIIFMTGRAGKRNEDLGMEMGAVDYISRPVSPPILLSRVNAHLASAATGKTLRLSSDYLDYEAFKHTQEMVALQDVVIVALATLSETRDVDTGNHLYRTQHYVKALCNRLHLHPRFRDFLSEDMIDILFKCAPLHDIGKVGIPDRILLNTGRYSAEEFEIMKTHPELGRDAIDKAQKVARWPIKFLEVAKELIYAHHEKWDGTGYPLGLAGEAIPISARLMALADVYDALVSRREYKAGMSHAQAAQIIVDGRGLHFDPDVVDAFVALADEFRAIAERYADTDQELRHKSDLVSRAVELALLR